MAVWNGASRFQKRSSVKTWIFRIAHNQAVSWLRKHKREQSEKLPDLPNDEDGHEEEMILAWRSNELVKALDQLSPKHRAVVELSFVHELTYKDIAVIVECPIGTVKSRMSYALRHMQGLLRKEGIDKNR